MYASVLHLCILASSLCENALIVQLATAFVRLAHKNKEFYLIVIAVV
jgi:hypothetical protein